MSLLKELTYGNHVLINGNVEVVRQITRKKVGYIPDGQTQMRWTRWSHIRPVPVTLEWVERTTGITPEEDDERWEFHTDYGIIDYYKEAETCTPRKIGLLFEDVHQLENFLKL